MTTQHSRTVVVGIDGSTAALHAVEWAAAEAVARTAVLRIVHVAPDHPADPVFGAPDLDRDYGESVLLDAAAVVVDQPDCPVIEPVYRTGEVSAVLEAEARTADLVVVGSTGVGALGELLVGSTAATLASSSTASVAIVCTPRHPSPTPDSRSTVVAVMTGPVDRWEHVMDTARREAAFRRSRVVAVLPGGIDDGTNSAAREALLQKWVEADPSVQIRVVARPGVLADRVVVECRRARLVVIGSGDHDRADRAADRVTHALLRRATCPVLVVRRAHVATPIDIEEPAEASHRASAHG